MKSWPISAKPRASILPRCTARTERSRGSRVRPLRRGTVPKKSRLLLIGYFRRGNLGDDAMHEGLLAFLREEIPTAHVRSVPLPAWAPRNVAQGLDLLRSLCWADAVILAGGTHFHDGYGRKSFRILLTHWLVFRTARLLSTSVGYAGIGIGPLHTRTGRWLVRRITNTASAILVRDRASFATMDGFRTRTPIIHGFDCASMLPLPSPAPEKHARIVGISLIPYFSAFHGDKHRDRAAVRSLAASLIAHEGQHELGADVLAFNSKGFLGDLWISDALVESLRGQIPVSSRTCSVPSETLRRLGTLNGLVATRYHAALMGYLVGLPTVVVAYEEKCANFAEDVGLPAVAVVQPEDLLRPERVSEILDMLTADPESLRPTVAVADSVSIAEEGLRRFIWQLLHSPGGAVAA